MKSVSRQVTDLNGARHVLTRQIGRGGQGAVFEVKGGRLAAKIVFDSSASRREKLRNQLTQVKRLPLADLEIARSWLLDGTADRHAAAERDLPSTQIGRLSQGVVFRNRWSAQASGAVGPHGRCVVRSSWEGTRLLGPLAAQHLRVRVQRCH